MTQHSPTPEEIRLHILQQVQAAPATIPELAQSIRTIGVIHGYDTAYRHVSKLRREGLLELRRPTLHLTAQGQALLGG